MLRALEAVGQPLLQLRSLTIKGSPVNDADITTVTMACPKLDYFCLQVFRASPRQLYLRFMVAAEWLTFATDAQSAAITGAAIAAISCGMPELTSLCLSACHGIRNDVTMQVRALVVDLIGGPLMCTTH
jgi:hypothetical protein